MNNSSYESCVASGDDPTGRFKTIVAGLDSYDAARSGDSISYVFSILRSVDNMLPLPTRPQWSVIFDLTASRLYLSTAKNADVRYFDINSFDYSCLTDVDVLDVNGEGSGDVRSRFVPYTTAINRALVEEALAPRGHLALNYVEDDQVRWNQLCKVFAEVFPGYHIIRQADNRILISRSWAP
jgi:hypothetical protein